ncbi:hypothetical protein, partial [Actinoplanes auranticolor]
QVSGQALRGSTLQVPVGLGDQRAALSEVNARKAVLVGQSGLGKFHALRAEADRLESLGQQTTYINLRGLNAQEACGVLMAELEHPGQRVSLMIDSLDEAVGTPPAMIRALSQVFDRYDTRIALLRLAVMSGSHWIRAHECQTCSSREEVCVNCRSTGVYGVLGTVHEKLLMAPLTQAQAREAAATDVPTWTASSPPW